MTHADIHDISQLLTAVPGIAHETHPGTSKSDPCIVFRPEDGDGSYTLRHDDRHGWVLDTQDELSDSVLGGIRTVRLPCADPSLPLLVAAAVEGVYRGLIDEFEAVR